MSPRPGFVLEVDHSTPPTLFWHGEGFRLERLPVGQSGAVSARAPRSAGRPGGGHPPRPAPSLGDAEPLPALLRPGMKLTIAFDDVSLPLAPMRRPDARQLVMEQVLDWPPRPGWTTWCSSVRWPCTGG
jgi:hypothetical protein